MPSKFLSPIAEESLVIAMAKALEPLPDDFLAYRAARNACYVRMNTFRPDQDQIGAGFLDEHDAEAIRREHIRRGLMKIAALKMEAAA